MKCLTNQSALICVASQKGLAVLLVVVGLFIGSSRVAHAATLYWVGADGANASVASNWSTTNPTSCSTGVTPSGAAPTSSDTINFDADCDNSATIDSGFTSTISVVVLNSGYAGTVTQANPLTVSSTFTTSGGTWSAANQALTVTSTFTMNAGSTFTASSETTTFSSGFIISGGTFNHNSGTVTFDGAGGTLSCNNITFNLVTFNNSSSTKTVSTNCSLPLGSNPTLAGAGNITLNGTMSGTGTLTKTAGAFTLNNAATTLSGFSALSTSAFVVSGATIDLSSYTSFQASSTTTVSSGSLTLSSQANTLVALTVSGGTVTQSAGTFSASGTVTLSTGALTLANGADLNGALTISGGTFTAPSGTMTLAGALTISGSPTFNANGGTITFDGAGATLQCNNVVFNLVTFANTAIKTVSTGCTLPLGSNPTLGGTQGISLINGGTVTGSGTLTMPSGTTLTVSTGSTLSAASGFTGMALQLLTVSGGTADFSTYSSFSAASTVSLSSGTLSLPSGADLNGPFSISGGTFNAPSGTMSLAGSLTITGSPTFNANGGTFILDGSSGDATLSCNNVSFNLVQFQHTGSVTKTISSNCTIPVGNNPTATGRIRLSSATATLFGTGLFTSTCELSNCLRLTAGTFTGFSGLIIYGNLGLDGANLDLSSYSPVEIYGRGASQSLSVTSTSVFTAPSVMTVADGMNIASTFNHNNGTVIYIAEAADTTIGFNALPSELVLYNLSVTPTIASTFNVPAGSTVKVLGSLEMSGVDSSTLLSLRSLTPGTPWLINALGSRQLSYLDVQDSSNTSDIAMAATCSTDSGNNTGWLFPPCGTSIFNLVSPSNRSYTRDERPTFSWRPPSELSFFDAAREYSLVIDNGQGSDFIVEGIPAQRPNGAHFYETIKYRVEYLNWDNEDLNDNLILLVTKSSSSWSSDYHDGKLTEGKRYWRVQLKDSSNTIYEMSNELFVDFTPPTTTISKINTLDYIPAVLTSDSTPTIFGAVTDELKGSPEDTKVASGPKNITIAIERKTLTGYELVTTDTISINETFWESDGKKIDDNTLQNSDKYSPFEYAFTKSLATGIYKITLTPRDNIDNAFASQIFQIRVASYDEVESSLTSNQQKTYQDQIVTKADLTIPDPSEDQEKLADEFSQQLKQKAEMSATSSAKKKYKSGLILGAAALAIVPFSWFFLIWKRRKKKPKGEDA
jgi:hypothetical protein